MEKLPAFEYKIGFSKNSSRYSLDYYNSPYKQSEQELDDISVIMDGKDLQGNQLPGLKTIEWEELENAKWEASILAYFIPNGDGSHNQSFRLKTLRKL